MLYKLTSDRDRSPASRDMSIDGSMAAKSRFLAAIEITGAPRTVLSPPQ